MKRVSGFEPLTIVTESSILDLVAVLDPPPYILSFFRRKIKLDFIFDFIMDDNSNKCVI